MLLVFLAGILSCLLVVEEKLFGPRRMLYLAKMSSNASVHAGTSCFSMAATTIAATPNYRPVSFINSRWQTRKVEMVSRGYLRLVFAGSALDSALR